MMSGGTISARERVLIKARIPYLFLSLSSMRFVGSFDVAARTALSFLGYILEYEEPGVIGFGI